MSKAILRYKSDPKIYEIQCDGAPYRGVINELPISDGGEYEKGIEFYEKLLPQKPTVQTERLNQIYWQGVNNYAVTLAKMKLYDDAIMKFQNMQESSDLNGVFYGRWNESLLAHYLGLFDVAIALYEILKSYELNMDGLIEEAYLGKYRENPKLELYLYDDESSTKDEVVAISLDNAPFKAIQEGNYNLYDDIFDEYQTITTDFNNFWDGLDKKIEDETILSQSDDDMASHAKEMARVKECCMSAIEEYERILNVKTETSLQESYRDVASGQPEVLKLMLACILSYEEKISEFEQYEDWSTFKNELESVVNSGYSVLGECMKERSASWGNSQKEYNKVEAKWNEIIDKEKATWRERLRDTRYKNWAPLKTENAHLEGKYNLSVPIFLCQAEGIFIEHIGNDLYENKRKKYLKSLPPIYSTMLDGFDDLVREISESFSIKKEIPFFILKRNAILHGRSIDYGTIEN